MLPSARSMRVRIAALVAGLAVSVVGGIHLAAWLNGTMAPFGPGEITMKANASLCLVLAGLALALLALGRRTLFLRLPGGLAAVAVLALGALTLAEHLAGLDLGIDQFLATEPPGAAAVTAPNRMGPPASLAFTLLGAGLLILTSDGGGRLRRIAHQPLAVLALVAGMLPVVGYLYGANALYGVARYTGIAWPTAVCVVALAVGVLCARPDAGLMATVTAETTGGELVRRLLLVAVLLPLGLGWLRLAGERAGWFDAGTGTGLTMVVVIVMFSVTVWIGGWWVTRSEAALRASREATRQQLSEIQAIYDSAHVGLCVIDRDLRYLRINRRLAEINGMPPEDHVGRRVEEVVAALAPFLGKVAEHVFRTGESATDIEVTGTTMSQPGVERTLRQQWVPLKDDSGHVVGINVVVEEITERKRAEEALRRSEDRLQALVRASSQAVFRMSPDWSEMLELQGGAFLANTETSNPAWMQQYIHPDDRGRVLEAIADAVRTGNPFTLEYRVIRVDESVGWTSARAVAVRDGKDEIVEWFGAASDITPRRQAEEALQHSQNRLATALEIAALGIWEYDLRSDLFSFDERCRDVFGVADDDPLPGDAVFALVNPDDRARVREEMTGAMKPAGRGLYDTEYRIARPDGTERWVAVRGHAVTPAEDAPEAARLVGTLMDITDRRRAEEALREANARLAEADRRKDEFIAILSHEIRNPLAPIRYALPLLEREALGDSAARAIAVVHRQVDHLTRLVDDFFDLSRINRGQIELRREDVSLEAVLRTAVEAASPAIVAGQHILATDVSAPPIWVNADRDRLAQVVTNLLNNSAKYTPSGGRIRLEAEERDGQVVIRVRDNGMGFDRDSLPGLFEMFQQGKRANRPQGGLGIGLAFARRLVEMHGGTIEAYSAGIGQGAEFVVRLPAGAGANRSEAVQAVHSAAPATHLKVLVVDDNPDLVQMLGVMLESDGHEVRKALDGPSAILTARTFRPHVVLLDLGLPVMGGLDVARELRRHPETANARLVALTGWGQAQDRKQTREAGFDHHLTKPTDPQVLQQLLAGFANELPGGKPG